MAATNEIAVTMISHPFCARQVAVKRMTGAGRFAIRIDMQHDSSHLLPIGTLRDRIEQPPIGHEMLFIVGRQRRIIRSGIGDLRIERRGLHGGFQ